MANPNSGASGTEITWVSITKKKQLMVHKTNINCIKNEKNDNKKITPKHLTCYIDNEPHWFSILFIFSFRAFLLLNSFFFIVLFC